MIITDIKTLVVNAELRNWIFVKVETSEPGLYGWGEATLEWKTKGVVGTIEDLKVLLIGKDPLNITQCSEIMNKHSFWKLGVIGKSAISGIDIALWDIKAKYLNVPVWQLLGGRVRDKIRMYTHLGMGDSKSVYKSFSKDVVIEKVLEVVDRGYDAIKVVFIPYINFTASPKEIAMVENLMASIREIVGENIDIMVDFHGRPGNAGTALQFIKAIESSKPMFVEEVIQPGELVSLKVIKQKINCLLAMGERLVSYGEFEPFFHERVVDIAQPDICHCGGFTEAIRICSAAAVAGIGIAPHNPLGPIAGIAALHLDISTPNFVIQEKMDAVPWFYDVIEGQSEIINGYCDVSNKPGLGIEINEQVALKHPYETEPINVIEIARIADGTIVNW